MWDWSQDGFVGMSRIQASTFAPYYIDSSVKWQKNTSIKVASEMHIRFFRCCDSARKQIENCDVKGPRRCLTLLVVLNCDCSSDSFFEDVVTLDGKSVIDVLQLGIFQATSQTLALCIQASQQTNDIIPDQSHVVTSVRKLLR